MNDRQRFLATMLYLPRDRAPICDFGFWDETLVEWHKQGLPEKVKTLDEGSAFFGMDEYSFAGPWVPTGLYPGFPVKVIEDRGDHEVVQQGDGVRVLRKKFMSSIPHHESHLLVDRASWNKHYKWRFDPTNPARYPKDWDKAVKIWTDPNREFPIALHAGSLYGTLRDAMGMENLSLVVYDDPAWFEEMVVTLADCVVAALSRVFEAGACVEALGMWEDMCYSAGPLLSPTDFKRYLMPHYRRITDLAHKYGVDVVWVDCDGKIDALMPLWLDVGVNCMFPVEIGTWGADPIKYRRQFGKSLLMMGGFDKHVLQHSKEAIDAEMERLTPLVEEGGYIPFCDHRVPPDVSLENYVHYLKRARQVWGKGVNLKAMGQFTEKAAWMAGGSASPEGLDVE